jgi:hypothetical protein
VIAKAARLIKSFTRSGGLMVVAFVAVTLCACMVYARTRSFPDDVTLGRGLAPDFIDRYAVLTEEAPTASHAAWETVANGGVWASHIAAIANNRSILIHYDLSSLPKGMRITNAELVLPVYTYSPTDVRFFVYRVLADWGNGASYKYRFNTPEKKVEWSSPGARGGSTDRATGSTASYRVKAAGPVTLNVTSDVEMWYTKAAPNNGWMFTVEEPGAIVGFYSHTYVGYASWVLRVTYEPE